MDSSEDEVFFGPVMGVESKKAAKLRRKTEVFQPNFRDHLKCSSSVSSQHTDDDDVFDEGTSRQEGADDLHENLGNPPRTGSSSASSKSASSGSLDEKDRSGIFKESSFRSPHVTLRSARDISGSAKGSPLPQSVERKRKDTDEEKESPFQRKTRALLDLLQKTKDEWSSPTQSPLSICSVDTPLKRRLHSSTASPLLGQGSKPSQKIARLSPGSSGEDSYGGPVDSADDSSNPMDLPIENEESDVSGFEKLDCVEPRKRRQAMVHGSDLKTDILSDTQENLPADHVTNGSIEGKVASEREDVDRCTDDFGKCREKGQSSQSDLEIEDSELVSMECRTKGDDEPSTEESCEIEGGGGSYVFKAKPRQQRDHVRGSTRSTESASVNDLSGPPTCASNVSQSVLGCCSESKSEDPPCTERGAEEENQEHMDCEGDIEAGMPRKCEDNENDSAASEDGYKAGEEGLLTQGNSMGDGEREVEPSISSDCGLCAEQQSTDRDDTQSTTGEHTRSSSESSRIGLESGEGALGGVTSGKQTNPPAANRSSAFRPVESGLATSILASQKPLQIAPFQTSTPSQPNPASAAGVPIKLCTSGVVTHGSFSVDLGDGCEMSQSDHSAKENVSLGSSGRKMLNFSQERKMVDFSPILQDCTHRLNLSSPGTHSMNNTSSSVRSPGNTRWKNGVIATPTHRGVENQASGPGGKILAHGSGGQLSGSAASLRRQLLEQKRMQLMKVKQAKAELEQKILQSDEQNFQHRMENILALQENMDSLKGYSPADNVRQIQDSPSTSLDESSFDELTKFCTWKNSHLLEEGDVSHGSPIHRNRERTHLQWMENLITEVDKLSSPSKPAARGKSILMRK